MQETYEVGGKVSVTLHDGTKIVDSPITGKGGKSRLFLNELFYLVTPNGKMGGVIASVDSYTPPAPPTWARPEVRMIMRRGDPAVKMYRSTLDGAALPDLWRSADGNGANRSTAEVAELASDWIVYAVAPEVEDE